MRTKGNFKPFAPVAPLQRLGVSRRRNGPAADFIGYSLNLPGRPAENPERGLRHLPMVKKIHSGNVGHSTDTTKTLW
jgi:hypothetical protein